MYVFISYAHIDEGFAQEIADLLAAIGIGYFLDEKDINWGQKITQQVQGGLRTASHLVVILSPGSAKSQWVAYEVGCAMATGKKVLPILTHPSLDIPGFLSDTKCLSMKNLEGIQKYFEEHRYDGIFSNQNTIDLSGEWISNFGRVHLQQNGRKFMGTYRYSTCWPDYSVPKESKEHSIDGEILSRDLAIFHWLETKGFDSSQGIGFWRLNNERELEGYWFFDYQTPPYEELKTNPNVLLELDQVEDRKWTLHRQSNDEAADKNL